MKRSERCKFWDSLILRLNRNNRHAYYEYMPGSGLYKWSAKNGDGIPCGTGYRICPAIEWLNACYGVDVRQHISSKEMAAEDGVCMYCVDDRCNECGYKRINSGLASYSRTETQGVYLLSE